MNPSTWPVSTPEALGVSSDRLVALLDHVRDLNLHSLLIVRGGYLILDAYRHPYHADSRHDVRSVAKSITALLAGIALHEGYITSLDQPVLSFFPDRADRAATHRDARQEAITLRHLLVMSSGMALTDADTGHILSEPDALAWVLDAPVAAAPGAQFVYSSSNYYLLAAVLERVTGGALVDYARAKLFDPLGIGTVRWQASRQGITLGFGGLWMASRDLARLGQLVLARGRWDGVPVVPETWIDTITCIQVPDANYGFGWWIEPDAVAMIGYGGQLVHVMPEHDLVTVATSGLLDPMSKVRSLIDTFVLPALHDAPLPENPTAAADLAARVVALGNPQPEPVPPLPETALRISGRCWRLGENGLGLTAITLVFEDTSGVLTLESGADRAVIPLGLDGVLRDVLVEHLGPLADHDQMAAVGRWRDDHTLIMRWYSINNPEYWVVEMAFDGETPRLLWEDVLSGHKETVEIQPWRGP